jgi:hypothetical protein
MYVLMYVLYVSSLVTVGDTCCIKASLLSLHYFVTEVWTNKTTESMFHLPLTDT